MSSAGPHEAIHSAERRIHEPTWLRPTCDEAAPDRGKGPHRFGLRVGVRPRDAHYSDAVVTPYQERLQIRTRRVEATRILTVVGAAVAGYPAAVRNGSSSPLASYARSIWASTPVSSTATDIPYTGLVGSDLQALASLARKSTICAVQAT